MKEITKEELCELLEKNPHWRFFQGDKEYIYSKGKYKFVWEGWDYYNDWTACDVISINVPKKVLDEKPWLAWHKFTIDKNHIAFWTFEGWKNRHDDNLRASFDLSVVTNVDVENLKSA